MRNTLVETFVYELRYVYNKNGHYNIVNTYGNPQLAYGMRNKISKTNPNYPLDKLKVVKVKSGRKE